LSIESQRVKRIAAVIERDLRAGMARELRVVPQMWGILISGGVPL